MRFIAAIVLVLVAFLMTSRLQVTEAARFVTSSGEVIEGRVSRDFVTGQYKIEQHDRSIRYVNPDDLGAMSFGGTSIPLYASSAGFLLIIVAGCIGLGVDRAWRHLVVNATRLRPGFTHDNLPPSQRES